MTRICGQLKIHSSSLAFLNHQFTAAEIDQINQFMMRQMLADTAVSPATLARLLQAVHPQLPDADSENMAAELIQSWLDEGTFKGILLKRTTGDGGFFFCAILPQPLTLTACLRYTHIRMNIKPSLF